MNTQTPEFTSVNTDGKRDALRAKIEAGERRIAERSLAKDAREAAQAAADYARAHPAQVVVGAVVVGVIIGLMTAPGRRVAADAAARVTGRKRRKRGSKLGKLFSQALVARVLQVIDELLESASEGRKRFDDIAGDALAGAKRLGHDAAEASEGFTRRTRKRAEDAAEASEGFARRARKRAEHAAQDVADRLRH